MQIRRIDIVALVAAAAAGIGIAPGTISGDVGRMLATFFGLVSASILPTISLLIGSMTSNGRSVLAINELKAELDVATNALFFIFGCIGIVVLCLASLSIYPPTIAAKIPYLVDEILPRCGQALVSIFSMLIILRSGQIPAIIRRTLDVRHKIAIEEARKKISESGPDDAAIRQSFTSHPEFGKLVNLEDHR